MKDRRFDTGQPRARAPLPRKSERIALKAEVALRRAGHNHFRVVVHDVSPHGCKIEFVEKPRLGDRVWVKFDELQALEGIVCWVDSFIGGIKFQRPMHPAVFEMMVANRML